MNLTHTLIDEDDSVAYHRLGRLNLTFSPSWGSLRIGRPALTWGNGMVFNPMDLFNPFAPTFVLRDYKVGDDMVLAQLGLGLDALEADLMAARHYDDQILARGDLFTMGRYYTAGLLQIELHPLVRNLWTFIANLEDPSSLVQPQLLWDTGEALQVILGAQWHWGGRWDGIRRIRYPHGRSHGCRHTQ